MYICESHSFWRSLNIPWNPEDRSLTITTKTRHPGGGRTRRTFGWVFSRRLSGAAENLPKQLMSTIGSSKRFDIDRREKIAPPFSSPNGFPLEISSFPLAFSKSLRGLAPRRVVYTPSPVSEGSSPQVAIWKTQQMTQSFLEDDVPILWAGYIYIYIFISYVKVVVSHISYFHPWGNLSNLTTNFSGLKPPTSSFLELFWRFQVTREGFCRWYLLMDVEYWLIRYDP